MQNLHTFYTSDHGPFWSVNFRFRAGCQVEALVETAVWEMNPPVVIDDNRRTLYKIELLTL